MAEITDAEIDEANRLGEALAKSEPRAASS
jgi:hypothetical protein